MNFEVLNANALLACARCEWENANRCAYPFLYRVGKDGPVEHFIQEFKKEKIGIINHQFVKSEAHANLAAKILSACLRKNYMLMFEESACKFLVPVPSHRRGYARGNLLRVATQLSKEFGLKLLDTALLRVQDMPASHKSRFGERPNHQLHSQSIQWNCKLTIDGGIILLDDVLTTGSTSQACRHIIMEKTGVTSHNVARLFLAKAVAKD